MSSYIETIKAVDGEVYHLDYHQQRYESVLKSFGVDMFKNLVDFLDPPKDGLYRCRLVYDCKDIVEVTYHKYKKRNINSLKVVFDNDVDYAIKSTNRNKLDSLFSKRDGCDDVLIIKNLLVTDTTIANIAFYKDGIWKTPKSPLLKGTTRARFLDDAKIVESNIKVQELKSFSKVALLNAMIDFEILDNCDFLV